MSNPTFVSSYTMEQLRADSEKINHKFLARRFAALVRLARMKQYRD